MATGPLVILEGTLVAPTEWDLEDEKGKTIRGYAGRVNFMGGFTKFGCEGSQALALEQLDGQHVRLIGEGTVDRKTFAIKLKAVRTAEVLDVATQKYKAYPLESPQRRAA